MKIRWRLTEFDGLNIEDQDDKHYGFIIKNSRLYIKGLLSNSTHLRYLKIKERMTITFWI